MSYAARKSSARDRVGPAARRSERGLVDEVREVGAREPGRARRDRAEIHVRGDRLLARVHREDRPARRELGPIDQHAPVEAAWPQERRVQHVGPVGRGHDHDQVVAQEAVHLGEELVQRLLALVVAAAEPRPARAADRVDLVDEDDAGAALLRLVEELAHAGRADARRTSR